MDRTTVGEERGGRPAGRTLLLVLVLAALLAGPYGAVGSLPSQTPSAPDASARDVPSAQAVPSPLGLGHSTQAFTHPFQSPLFYTQIGATLTQVNRSDVISGMATIVERIPLVTSPYDIAYELNGLTDTGDWYQIVVADNWPGCSAGFEEAIEIWDNTGAGQPLVCDPTLTLSQGDMTQLTINVRSSTMVCMGLTDLRTRLSHQTCVTQPDTGATVFEFLSSSANHDGYYTGTMTEVVNTSATSCPRYALMPTVTFDFPTWANITEYVGWSDERDLGGSGLLCYSASTGIQTLDPGDPSSHFADSTGGSSYGPHYLEGQNDSFLNSTTSFRFQTDVVVLDSETISASTLAPPLGSPVSLHAIASGGVPPYGKTIWRLNGTLQTPGSAWWNWTASGSGNDTFVASVVDHTGDVSPASAPVVVRVPFALWAGTIRVGGRSGADVNQTIVFSVRAGGGIGWLSYAWAGLPRGCASANVSSLTCTPTSAGASSVSATIRDSTGATQGSAGLPFIVSTDPVVTVRGDPALADIGQVATFRALVAGGSGGNHYSWQNLLPGCRSITPIATCNVTVNGNYPVAVAVTDSNGYSAQSLGFSFTSFLRPNVTLRADRPVVDLYANLTVTASVVGGAGGFEFTWGGLPGGCAGGDLAAVHCAPTSQGNSLPVVTVVDQANGSARSSAYRIAVVASLAVALTASVKTVIAPGNVTFTVGVSGGSQILSAVWHGLPGGCPPIPGFVLDCRGVAAGAYNVSVTVNDVGGGSAAARAHVLVQPAPIPIAPTNVSSGPTLTSTELAIIGVALILIVVAAAVIARRARRP